MEPERNIEKWLRAFARKRRGEARDFKLHPFRRRQLQDEVARQFAEDAEPEGSVTLWQLFRQRWVMLAGFTLLIFFVATMFAPALSKAKHKAIRTAAVSNLKQIGVAAQIAAEDNQGRLPATLDALTNGLLAPPALTDPVSGKPFVYVAAGETLGDLQSNSVLAYSPEDKKGRALLYADGSVEVVSGQKFDEFKRRGLLQPGRPMELALNAPAPVTAPALAESQVMGGGGGGGGTFGLSSAPAKSAAETTLGLAARSLANDEMAALSQKTFFFRLDRELKPGQDAAIAGDFFYKQSDVTSAPPAVLASFEFIPGSNAVQVVDADGSVYHGNWQSEVATAAPAAPAVMPPLGKAKTYNADKLETTGALAGGKTFRVAGQNRTTKQNVVFTGTLTATNAAQTNLFLPARLSGTLTLDETNRIEIQAVPATP